MTLSIVFTLATAFVLFLSLYFEQHADQKDDKLRVDIENGKYGDSEEWREQYISFANEKGFESVKHATMRTDLRRRYFRPTGIFMLLFAIAVFVIGICFQSEFGARLFFGIVSCGLFAYGIYCLSTPNVWTFIKRYSNEYHLIENSYLGGKQLTFRKKAADKYCNDGINIGSDFVVIFNKKEIVALRYSDITKVKHRILRTKYYGNSVYMGTVYTHHIDVTGQNPLNGDEKTFTAQLTEFQAELAYRTLNRHMEGSKIELEYRETDS